MVTYNLYGYDTNNLWHCVWICIFFQCFFFVLLEVQSSTNNKFTSLLLGSRTHSCFRFDLAKCIKCFYFVLQINDKRSINRIRSPRKSEIEVSQFIDQCFQAHNEYRSKHKVPPLILSKKVRKCFMYFLM